MSVKRSEPAARGAKQVGGTRGAKQPGGLSDAERNAIKERARELRSEARAGKSKADGEKAVVAAIAAMPPTDRTLGEQLHAIVRTSAPQLTPKLWYGMPAYANADGKVVCFFQAAAKFKTRYASFAFTDAAKLDDGAGAVWPTGFGLKELSAADQAKIAALVTKALV